MNKPKLAFSLIELLIVIAIVGILAAIAYPNYQHHLRRSRRVQAQHILLDLAGRLEQHYIKTHSYKGIGIQGLGVVMDAAPYHFTLAVHTAHEFTLRANPTGGQRKDGECGTLVLDSVGRRSVTGGGSIDKCWG